jgi:hypothetical protein
MKVKSGLPDAASFANLPVGAGDDELKRSRLGL